MAMNSLVRTSKKMLRRNSVVSIDTIVKIPQYNYIVERLHQTISTMLVIFIQEDPPINHDEIFNFVRHKCVSA